MYSEDDESQEESYVNYKQKYRELKKHLRALIYENECLQDELRKAQRNFVSISRDKSFLLDRILKYEKPTGPSSDSEATESSEEEEEARIPAYNSPSTVGQRKKITKRKRSEAELSNGGPSSQSMDVFHGHGNAKVSKPIPHKAVNVKQPAAAKKPKKPPTARKPSVKKERVTAEMASTSHMNIMRAYGMGGMQGTSSKAMSMGGMGHYGAGSHGSHKYDYTNEGQMTREDIERHLEARRYSPEMELNTTATVPAELFSQDPDQESDLEGSEICDFVNLDDGTADMMIE